jgi:PAS domain S-box-containing protein
MGQERPIKAELVDDLATLRREREGPASPSARAEEAELAPFFAQSLDLLCIAGLDGRFKRLNPAWATHLGWTLDELLAKPFIEFVHPDDREATLAEFATLAEGGDTVFFENRYVHRDGSYRWLQWNARPVPGRRRIYATARDVTRRKRLEREVLEIVDRERERLGRELHDGLCQALAGIAALSSTLSRRLAHSDPGAATAAADIASMLGETIIQARDMARGLGPVDLNEAGLDGALETLALNVRHLFRVSCTIECSGTLPRLGHDVEAHLFRITQEAVNNAITHGRAGRIEISLSHQGGQGLLEVRDDGVGLPEKEPSPEGIGMHTMSYRARLIRGRLEVRRSARGGTAVVCAFPLAHAPGARESTDHVRT